MSAETRDPLILLAERVAVIATELGIPTALIGATALAVHNYVRGTADIDLATAVDPFRELPKLQERLESEGLDVELSFPDAEDILGGVLRVRARGVDNDPVEIVNFHNPLKPSSNPGLEAVQTATPIAASSALRCATLGHLIALKLFAGSRRDQADVVELLRRNTDADHEEIRNVCERYGYAPLLDELTAEARGGA
jgi:hypothetical protein